MFHDYREFIAGMWAFNGHKAIEFINNEIEHTLIMGNFTAVDLVLNHLINLLRDNKSSVPKNYCVAIADATKPAVERLNNRTLFIEILYEI